MSPTRRSTSARRSGCSVSCGELVASGITILYVSHRLEEVFSISDRITVMRNGRARLDPRPRELTIAEVVEAMVGASQQELYPPRASHRLRVDGRQPSAAELEIEGLTVRRRAQGCLLQRPGRRDHRAGRSRGRRRRDTPGRAVRHAAARLRARSCYRTGARRLDSPTDAARRGVALVPADRRHQGLMLDRSVARNIIAGLASAPSRGELRGCDHRRWHEAAPRQIERLRIKVQRTSTVGRRACLAATSRRSSSANGSRWRPG